MENFKVNLNRPEPDKGKIQAKKDFNSFHNAHFPKPTVFKSKWFWGVSGIASIAVVVTVTMSSFSSSPERIAQNETQELISSPKSELLVPSRVDEPTIAVESGMVEVEKDDDSQKEIHSEEMTEPKSVSLEADVAPETNSNSEYKPSVKELFELDFDVNEFPDLQVGNNLFYIHPSEEKSSNELFDLHWDDVDLKSKDNQIHLKLVKDGEIKMFRIVQYIK